MAITDSCSRWRLLSRGVLTVIALAAMAAPATAAGPVASKSDLDLVWILTAAVLVMLMQVGFLLLEAGMVRSKNSINVAQKNLLAFVFGIVAFSAVGFMFAFGPSNGNLFGFDADLLMLNRLDQSQLAFFFFQVMFCGTAATIVSGAVAERMKLSAYIAGSLVLSGFIYPVFVHWAWGSSLGPDTQDFLGDSGFVDFAGSTVVHATSGWIALAACMIIGPRKGRFREDGEPVRINGHSPVLSTSGALLLFIGWIGFNGGSTLRAEADVAGIVVNTILAGGFGCAVGYAYGIYRGGVILPEKPYTGMLGALVAVTAGCQVLEPAGAMAIGAIGALVAIYMMEHMERRWKIDDSVGAVAIHAFAGVAGTILLALLAPVEHLPTGDRFTQFGIQVLGSVTNFVWSFTLGYGLFWLLDKAGGVRVSEDDEEIGLNVAEHATRLGLGHVEAAFSDFLSGKADIKQRLPIEAGDDAEKITRLFNQLMDQFEAQERDRLEMEQYRRDRQDEERVAALANATFEAIFIHRNGIIIDANEQFARLFEGEIADFIGTSLFDLIDENDRQTAIHAVKASGGGSFEIHGISCRGTRIPLEARQRDIVYRNDPASVVCLVDLRERKEAEIRIRHLAQHDTLTGLPNRALFNDELAACTAKGSDSAASWLVLVDVDRFKDINDIHGHQAGDAVIREVAARLQRIVGSRGFVARLGGDEFALILPAGEQTDPLESLCSRIVEAFTQPFDVDIDAKLTASVSIGAACCPDHAHDAEGLFALADVALYESKNAGRNCWTIFKPGMNAIIEKRRELEAALDGAIERNELELFLQPRVCCKTGTITSYEALLRWNNAELGSVGPADFIPVAEASGKIIQIGAWVIAEACRMLATGLEGRSISINVSPLQFRHPSFLENLLNPVRQTGVDASRLEIEITESVLIDDDMRALHLLNEIKAAGFSIALDDFGTGYSSLSYLSRYPFDAIKVDRSFVKNLSTSESAPVIIHSIVELGAALGMKVVAEGVETVDEAVFLAAAGCDQLQGYLLGQPRPFGQRLRQLDPELAASILSGSTGAVDPVTALRTMSASMRRVEKRGAQVADNLLHWPAKTGTA